MKSSFDLNSIKSLSPPQGLIHTALNCSDDSMYNLSVKFYYKNNKYKKQLLFN